MGEVALTLADILALKGPLNIRTEKTAPFELRFCQATMQAFDVFAAAGDSSILHSIPFSPSIQVITGEFPNSFHLQEQGKYLVGISAMDNVECLRWSDGIKTLLVPRPRLSIDDFEILAVLGRGFAGKVMLVERKTTGEQFALKTVRKSKLLLGGKPSSILAERNIMLLLDNPFIVQLYFAFQTPQKFYFGLEYAPGGELYYHMSQFGLMSLDDARLYAAEIAIALDYLHSRGVVYRDLKPENILFDECGHIKLTDFGLAKEIGASTTSTFCGTSHYLAPEIITRQGYSYPIDWWALGILLCEMVTGQCPFPSGTDPHDTRLTLAILHQNPDFVPGMDLDVQDLIQKLLTKDPKVRPGLQGIKSHSFFAGLDWDLVRSCSYQPDFIPEQDVDNLVYFDQEFVSEPPVDSSDDDVVDVRVDGFSFSMPSLMPEEDSL
jgi:serine/threonine protein kinase